MGEKLLLTCVNNNLKMLRLGKNLLIIDTFFTIVRIATFVIRQIINLSEYAWY